jgi:hypothetical protein
MPMPPDKQIMRRSFIGIDAAQILSDELDIPASLGRVVYHWLAGTQRRTM